MRQQLTRMHNIKRPIPKRQFIHIRLPDLHVPRTRMLGMPLRFLQNLLAEIRRDDFTHRHVGGEGGSDGPRACANVEEC